MILSSLQRLGILIWCAALGFAIYLMFRLSVPYVAMKPNVDFLQTKQKVYHIDYWRISFYAHVFTSILVLPAGFTQFNRRFFSKGLHRKLGLVYILAVLLISAPTGFLMGLHANGGLASKTSFVFLRLLWFGSTLMAVVNVRRKNFEVHGEWMLYSYALAFSAITFRLLALGFDFLHLDVRPTEVYVTIAWLSWVPNLVLAQVLIKSGFIKRIYWNRALNNRF